ncbi:hypothetical protein, partial [Vibrio parahaemolyticus]
MKLITDKQRHRDVIRSLRARRSKSALSNANNDSDEKDRNTWLAINEWINTESRKGLKVSPCKREGKKKRKNYLEITLPATMDFYANYDATVQTLTAIR